MAPVTFIIVIQYEKGTTWTTDGFFRETPNQVLQAKKLGVVAANVP